MVLPLAMALGTGHWALALSHSGPAGHLRVHPNLLDMPCPACPTETSIALEHRPRPGPKMLLLHPTTIYDTGPPAQQMHLVACLDVV